MKTRKSLQQILVASTLIGLLITPNAAMAGKLKFGRSNSFSRQSSTSNRNLNTKSMTTNSANTFKPQGKGAVSKTQMKSSVVKTKSSRQSRLSATPKLQPSNNLKKQGISNRTLPKLTNKGNGRKMSLGGSQSFLGQQRSLRTSPGTFPPKNNGSLRVMPSKSKGAANATRSMQPAVILPRKGKKGSSTLSSSRGKFDGSKSTQLLRPIRPGSLQLVKPGKGAATNTAIKLNPTKKQPIQSNPNFGRPVATGPKTTRLGRKPLAPGLNMIDRTEIKKLRSKKESEQNPLPSLPEGDVSGTATAQFIPIPSADDVVDFVEDKAEDADEAVGNVGEAIGDAISVGAEELGGAISDGAEYIGDAIDDSGDNFGGPADDLADKLGGAVGNVGKELGGTIGNTGREAGDFIRENGNKAGEQIQDGAKWGADKGRDVIDRGEMLADEIKQRGEDIANDARERGEELANEAEEALNDAREDANDAIDQFQEDFLGHDRDPNEPGNDGKDQQEDPRQENNPPANGNDNADNGTPQVENEEQPTDEVEQPGGEVEQPGEEVEQPVDDEPVPEPNEDEAAQDDQYEEEQEYQDDEQYEDEYDAYDDKCVLPPIQIWLPGPQPVIQETVIVRIPAPAPFANPEMAVETEEEEDAQLPQVPVGATLELAGQNLGQQAGQVLLKIGVLSLPTKVEAWDKTITVTLPSFGLEEPMVAELHVVRADGELDTVMAIELVPALSVIDQE